MLKLNIDEKHLYYIRITVVMVAISACVALLLGIINAVTADKIAENEMSEFTEALKTIFPNSDNIIETDITAEYPIHLIYEVKKTDEKIGYCIQVLPKGFDGTIDIIVGTDVNGTILGVQVVSHSETPGLGSRAADQGYLEAYKGLNGHIRFGGNNNLDAVAGATITSKAILEGVNAALAIEGLFDNGGAVQ
jgi:electron transport complex, RnfABCDGE type, G subunit